MVSFYGYGLDRRHLHALQEVGKTIQEEEKAQAEGQDKHDEGSDMSDHDVQRIGNIVDRWLTKGGHLHSGITIQTAADEMKIPRYQLSAWLKTTDQELFSPWLTHLRIEEAKRLMKEHPDWSNDVIAERCGFNTRNYFQTVFKKLTGQTPAQFLAVMGDR